MTKPFVLITPEAEREALRKSGVLPERFFRVFDIKSNGLRKVDEDENPVLHFWPYDLQYSEGADRTEDGVYKPDIPAFFGLKPPLNDERKRHDERLITGLLGSVMVHVVFLDSRRGQNGYAAFKSFPEIVKWGRALRRALNVRFRNEDALQSMESVLVIVARGEQVTLRPSDIEQFNDCVQRWRGDLFSSEKDEEGNPLRKIFQSCYFLDYNLCVRDSRELYHSAEVWDVVVARLLLSFLLARKGKIRWWQIPGVKLWRSLGCLSEIDADSAAKVVDEALEDAHAKLQDYAAKSEDLDDLTLLRRVPERDEPIKDTPLEPADAGHTEWRHEPSGGWSDFGAAACAEKSSQGSSGPRWNPAFARIAKAFGAWCVERVRSEVADDVGSVFKAVHRSPGNLIGATAGLYAKLAKGGGAPDRTPEENWRALVSAERARCQAIRQIRGDAAELEKAQRHYVGLGMSAVTVVAVSLALGSASYYLIRCLGCFMSLSAPAWVVAAALFVLFSLGSVCAGMLMLGCHLHAGRRAVAKLGDESEAIDALMTERDRRARKLVEQGAWMRDCQHLQGLRFRSWTLLKRTQDILVTELQPSFAKRSEAGDSDMKASVESERKSVRETFLARTNKVFGPYRITMKENLRAALDRTVACWWSDQVPVNSTSGSRAQNFFELWRELCSDDKELAGYFPARPFADGIRSFVRRFSDAIRQEAKLNVLQSRKAELRAGLLKWYEDLQDMEYYLYATGAVTGEHVNESQLENARVYLSGDEVVDLDAFAASHRGSQADQSRFMPEVSLELNMTRHLALLFQEIKIQFCCDAEGDDYGHLTFKEVADVPGGGNA